MLSPLENTEVLPKLHTDARANEVFYHSKCWGSFQYHITFSNKSKKKNTDSFQKSGYTSKYYSIAQAKTYENPECPIEARVILEI